MKAATTAMKEEKKKMIEEYRLHEKDTGSVEVQVSLLTQRSERIERTFYGASEGFSFAARINSDGGEEEEVIKIFKEKRRGAV